MEDTQAQTTETEVTAEPTLDDVIKEYNVNLEPEAQAQPAAAPAAQSNSPLQKFDPLDDGQVSSFVEQINTGQSVLNNQLNEVRSELTNLRQERAQLQIETDINKAIGTLNENLNLDPKLVRVHLEYTAQEKPGFKALWENRNKNPQAYQKGLEAIGREMRDTYSVRQDSELTANQQAIKQSQKSMATKSGADTSDNSIEAQLAGAKNSAEWNRIWSRFSSSSQ